jgi:hypothetical protein
MVARTVPGLEFVGKDGVEELEWICEASIEEWVVEWVPGGTAGTSVAVRVAPGRAGAIRNRLWRRPDTVEVVQLRIL